MIFLMSSGSLAQVRLPMRGPSFNSLKLWQKMSPSLPACSLVSATMGPIGASLG